MNATMTEPIDGTRIVFSMEARPIRAISRLFLAMGTLFVVSGTQMGWVALSQASAPGSETTFLLGFAAIALAAGLAQIAVYLSMRRKARSADPSVRRITPLTVTAEGLIHDAHLHAGDRILLGEPAAPLHRLARPRRDRRGGEGRDVRASLHG
ncbi:MULTISPECIES: hypothetical protein [Methylobacteriaceae]|uniref:Envelope glycoprotein gp160 n=1 Tax=Methylorubrum populi TaxID=223967 RepID=A0A160PCX2_9HYPH|nr:MULTISPECIES: hypothetical protein [Methylobacteriaceae]MBY0250878.1 hypothetical protein [Methylobacterium organophilum]MDV2984050.1 hypothetical protein [Methylobacteriaceae bacterium AG10]RUP04292.1 MAG: hypothetical protein EKK34_14785 [Mycobacterium sp.]BAU89030.1 envelope glycoprotein gp160 [Methylorubrum populi]